MKSVSIRFSGLIAGFAALSLLAAPALAAPAAKPAAATPQQKADPSKPMQPSESKEFGDWSVRCYPVTSASPCEMVELLVNKKTGRRVLSILIAYIPSRDQHVMQIGMPLGVMLQNGAVLNSDTFTSDVLHFRRCDIQGCYVETPIDGASLNALARATKAQMQIVSVDGKKFELAFSLNGFTSAHNALVDLTKQKASGAPAASPPPPAEQPAP